MSADEGTARSELCLNVLALASTSNVSIPLIVILFSPLDGGMGSVFERELRLC